MKRNESIMKRTVRISYTEGIFAQIYMSLAQPGSIFITKFLVMLGGLPIHFGILSAVGQFSQIFQPAGVIASGRSGNRRRNAVFLAGAGRIISMFFGLLIFIMPQRSAMWIFLLLFMVSNSIQAVSANIWVAWVSDLIPLRFRGRFFSRRAVYLLATGLIAGYVFSIFLDMFSSDPPFISSYLMQIMNNPHFLSPEYSKYAFLIIFLFASVTGIAGLFILNRQPDRTSQTEDVNFLKTFSESFKDKNFVKFLLYSSWWMLAVGIGSPFWQPFMIKHLHMSLFSMQIYGTISTLASVAALRFWGKIIDRFGNKTAMRIIITVAAFNPIVWLFANAGNYWIIYFEAFTAGVTWSGAGVIATNFVLSIAPEGRRQIYSGIYGAVSGLAMMTTMLLSSILMPPAVNVLGLSMEPEQVLFAATAFARFTTQIPLTWIHEPEGEPMNAALYYFRQFAKVRISSISRSLSISAAIDRMKK